MCKNPMAGFLIPFGSKKNSKGGFLFYSIIDGTLIIFENS